MSGTNGDEGQAPASEGLGSGERPEREAARAEVAEPRGRPRQAHRQHRFSWRTPLAALLIVVGCVLAPVSVLAVWTANQVSDTSQYVANVAPLIKDPAIQNALTDKLTSEIVTKIDVKGLTDQVAAELSHKGLPKIGGLLQGVSGSVARGLTIAGKIPIVHATFALFPSKNLVKAQKAYRLINDLKIVLPILTLVLLGLGVFIARGRRRALIGAGLGFAASMLVLGACLAIARALYLNSVPASASAAAAAAAFDILVRFIKTALRTLLVVGLIVAVGALFTGPSSAAVRTRSAFSSGLGRLRRGGESAGLSTGPVGAWTYAHRHALRIGAVALAGLIFVFQGQPTAAVTIVIAVLLLVALGLIELIGRPPPHHVPTPPATSG